MTAEEVADVLEVVARHWPHARLGDDPQAAIETWHAVLGRFDVADVQGAVERLLSSRWPPTAGEVAAEAQTAVQGDALPFEEIGAQVERAQHWLPYNPLGNYTPQDTARAVAVLQARGVHEAVLRFVAALGLRAVLAIPWGDRNPLDLNQSADRRDMARAYRHNTLEGWRRDPRPGLALERACQAAQLDPGTVLAGALAGQAVHRASLEPPPVTRGLLEPGPAEAEGETVDFGEAVAVFRRRRAQVEEERAAEAAAARRAGDDAQRAALSELEAHKERIGGAR